jgi:hypothetical protein
MNQIFKKLILNPSSMYRLQNACAINSLVNNTQIRLISSKNLNNFNKFSYELNDNEGSFSNKRVSNFDGFKKGGYGRDFGYSKRPTNRNKSYSPHMAAEYEDVEGIEPIESTGQQADYKTHNATKFSDFEIPEQLQNRLKELGYETPFEIQEKTLKHTLAGK